MRPAVLLLLPAALLPTSAPALGDASDLHWVNAEVQGRLSGVWQVVERETAAGKDRRANDFTEEFGHGQRVTRLGRSAVRTDCTTDDTRNPPWITVPAWKGIYRINGNTLTICWGRPGDRPRAFRVGGPDGGLIILTLQRVR